MSGVTFGHHGGGFESRVSDFGNGKLFVIGFFSRDDGSIWWKHEMDSRIWNQVSL